MENDLRYPIGEAVHQPFSHDELETRLAAIRFLPNAIEASIVNLNEEQLHTPYRDGGWTVHQVVHHVADSHMNAYTRFKLGFTEDGPGIKPYEEKKWAELADVKELPVNISITLLFALHQRWYIFLKSFAIDDWMKTVYHPEKKREITLWELLGTYAWHGQHHTAQINALRKRMNWR